MKKVPNGSVSNTQRFGPQYSCAGGRVRVSRNLAYSYAGDSEEWKRLVESSSLYVVDFNDNEGSTGRTYLTQEQFTDMLEGFLAVRESYEEDNG